MAGCGGCTIDLGIGKSTMLFSAMAGFGGYIIDLGIGKSTMLFSAKLGMKYTFCVTIVHLQTCNRICHACVLEGVW